MFKKKNKKVLDDDIEIIEPLTKLTDKLYRLNKKKKSLRTLSSVSAGIFGGSVGFCLTAIFTGNWAIQHIIIACIGFPFILPAIYAVKKGLSLTDEIIKLEHEIYERETEEMFDLSHSKNEVKDIEIEITDTVTDTKAVQDKPLISQMVEPRETLVDETSIEHENQDSISSQSEDESSIDEINV